MSSRRSRVHPKYETKRRVSDWTDTERALGQRGGIARPTATGAIVARDAERSPPA